MGVSRAFSPPSLLFLPLLALFFHAVVAEGGPDDGPQSLTSPSNQFGQHAGVTKVVSIFYIDERAYEGLPYTLFHRDSGSVIGIDAEHTTYVITTTRVDQRPSPTHSRTDNITTGIITLKSRPSSVYPNATGQPSTITQGPATFMFTGTRYGPNNTLINQCSLNGTVSAVCNLTHVGSAWYTSDPSWNGTFSTYSYNWTSGVRWGFAPVTITMGAELLQVTNPTASRSISAAAAGRAVMLPASGAMLGSGLVLLVAIILGILIML